MHTIRSKDYSKSCKSCTEMLKLKKSICLHIKEYIASMNHESVFRPQPPVEPFSKTLNTAQVTHPLLASLHEHVPSKIIVVIIEIIRRT